MPKPFDPEARMSLFEHLQELRTRLIRCVIAVAVFGTVSLIFARPIFQVLMKPVLDALPAESRSLIYTSGIEEINVLMKVGLYCGLFLTTPVILWQLWGFIAPGLYNDEKKFAAPFVVMGTLAFLGGALFCYFGLLPTMFQFLLQEGDSGALQIRLDSGHIREQEAVRYLRLGDLEKAAELAKDASDGLHSEGDGQIGAREHDRPSEQLVEVTARLDGLGRLMDATYDGIGPSGRPVLRKVMEKRLQAVDAMSKGDFSASSAALDESAGLLASIAPTHSGAIADVWKLEKDLSVGKARYNAQTWTRPMLTMSEQLSLVLLLELAFGVIFELPLVMTLLGFLGLIKSKWLMKYQRHAFVVCLIAAAVITPTGDAVNLALMAGPMLLCFELGVLGVWLIERRRRNSTVTAITPPP